ncbi:hypothetical protein A8B98_04530 [Hymenobacter sp. UV11]|nr:hypothetical protein A8B98_04530 [Hymenobacter sp. UV11]
MAVVTMARATTPRAQLLWLLPTGAAGTAAVGVVATAYVAVADMAVAMAATAAVAGADDSTALVFKQ